MEHFDNNEVQQQPQTQEVTTGSKTEIVTDSYNLVREKRRIIRPHKRYGHADLIYYTLRVRLDCHFEMAFWKW